MRLSQQRNALDTKEISAVELTEEYLKRIEENDIEIHSYITVCRDEAIKSAKAAQKLIDKNEAKPLTGIPLSVKDNICTNGIRTTCASKMLSDFVPFYDASVISKIKSENAVILGKTNMDEFAMGSSSQTSYFGGVKNPHNTEYIPGGSSGGAAAAVSSKLCSAALASDTGGSILQPSAFCGVTGIRPTYGLVSRCGLIAFASSLDQIGVIAGCAEDAGYVLNCITGKDEKDMTSRSNSLPLPSQLTIGVVKEFFENANEEISSAVWSAVDYYKALGYKIVECSLPSLEYAVSAYYLISSAEAASNLSRFDGIRFGHQSSGTDFNELIKSSRHDAFGEEVKRRIMLGNYALSSGYYEEYYNKAKKVQAQIKHEYNEIFKTCDVLITPTAPETAWKINSEKSDFIKMYQSDICTVPSCLAGLPTITTTCEYAKNSMPIGMSITGKHFYENTIIALCDRFECDFEKEAVL